MASAKRKAVISAHRDLLDEVDALVRRGQYRTVSEFMGEAVAEKLARLRRERLAAQVARYCDELPDRDDAGRIAMQAFDERPTDKARRAKR